MIDHNWEGSCPAPLSEMHPKSILQIGYFYFPNRKTSGRNRTISQIFSSKQGLNSDSPLKCFNPFMPTLQKFFVSTD